ncbi:ComEA family DNA-binding protein [Actinophytocola sediminis]
MSKWPGRAVRIGSLWYVVVPVLTAGLLTFLPFLHAAIRLRRLWVWLATVVFVMVAGGVLYVSGQPEGTTAGAVDAVFVIGALSSMVVGTTVLVGLRREVFGLGEPEGAGAEGTPAIDPAVGQILRARTKRAQARELAAADPLMARELRIGRPDLSGDYDDGGLVDLATAPEAVIAEVLELSAEQAEDIVAVRDTVLTVDDVFSLAELPVSAWDRIKDRAVVIR